MKIVLDRRFCTRWQASCEACFASRLTKGDFEVADCALSVSDNHRPEISFKIYDRDGSVKDLVVNAENAPKAYDSWLLLWEEQAGLVI
jgi:hypothetical protein